MHCFDGDGKPVRARHATSLSQIYMYIHVSSRNTQYRDGVKVVYNCGNSEEPLELAIQQLAQTIKDYDNSQQEKNQCFVPPVHANTNPPTPGGIH